MSINHQRFVGTLAVLGSVASLASWLGGMPMAFAAPCFAVTTGILVWSLRPAHRPADSPAVTQPDTLATEPANPVQAMMYRHGQYRWWPVWPSDADGRGDDLYRVAVVYLEGGQLPVPHGAEVAAILRDWVEWQYHQHVTGFPGAVGESTKDRFYKRAFTELRRGTIIEGPLSQQVAREMERCVASLFMQEN